LSPSRNSLARGTVLSPVVWPCNPQANEARAGWTFFPEDDLDPQDIADPLRPQSAMVLTGFTSSGIPGSGGGRFVLRLGALHDMRVRRWD
jgi:hypothetical protein